VFFCRFLAWGGKAAAEGVPTTQKSEITRIFVIFFVWGSLIPDASTCSEIHHTVTLLHCASLPLLLCTAAREPASFIFCNRCFVQLFNWCSLLCCPSSSQAKAAKTACIETNDGDGCC